MADTFEHLEVWKKSLDFGVHIYELVRIFPAHEQFGLSSQLRRAAVSISSNLAEGSGRSGVVDKCRFVEIAIGSLCEVESQLYIAEKLTYITSEQLSAAIIEAKEVGRLLGGYKRYLSKSR